MLLATLILQVATTAVHGIITQQSNTSMPVKFEDGRTTLIKFEEGKSAPRHSRKINGTPPKIQNWKSILRDATFQSLIKHTAFTPSLEEKMQSDRLLWEKLQSAKFLRKSTVKGEDPNEKVRMGILVDMTADGGSLEFRQSDRSVYTCPDSKCEEVLRRLLAIWKVQRFEPNDTWIRIKVPRHKQDEDVYEYTPKHGLQQMNTRFSNTSNSVMKNTTTADTNNEPDASTNKQKNGEVKEPILDERMSKIGRRMDLGKSTIYEVKHLRAKDYLVNKGKIETSGKYDTYSIPQTVSQQIRFTSNTDKPRQNLFFQIQPVEPSVISIEPKFMKEFQGGKRGVYDGFMPSLGPTGSSSIDYTLQFAEHFPKFTEYATEIRHNTGNRGKISFRPSPKFVQYSEPDPIYHSEMVPTKLPQQKELLPINFSQELNNTQELNNIVSSIITTPQTHVNDSIKAITKLSTELEHEEQTDSSINVSRFADTKGNEIHLTTKSSPRRVHTKSKNQLKSILRVSSGEIQDYAPLYAKWGEKIKTTPRPGIITMLPLVSKDVSMTSTIGNIDNNTSPPTTKEVDREVNVDSSTTELKESLLNSNVAQKSTNLILEDIEDKSPEEIVNALTNLGVKNTTRVEGYPPVSEKTLETSSKILEKMNRDTKSPATDPISLIVNRISQSYSYRTSTGNVKNFRKMRRRLGHR